MIDYDWRTATVNVGQPVGTIVKVLGENSRRVAIHVYASNNAPANTAYALNDRELITNYWAIAGIPTFITYPYRDFGPIIQTNVFLLCFDINAVWTVTEVYRVN